MIGKRSLMIENLDLARSVPFKQFAICNDQFAICNLFFPFVLLMFLAPAPTVRADDLVGQLPRIVSVAETYNNRPFEYRIVQRAEKTAYTVYRLSYPSPVVTEWEANNTVPAEYYVPNGIEPGGPRRPAVICLHILDGDFELVRITCSVLASRGIPAVMFKLPYYGERGLPHGPDALARDPEMFVGALAQALEDVRRTVDLLASRPEIDPDCIGITGISLGGITAATAAAQEQRIHRAVLILAGGDLGRVIHHARETKDLSNLILGLPLDAQDRVETALDAVDPLCCADKLAARAASGRVLMVNAGEDEVIPPECTRQLAAELGISDKVIWLEGLGHYTAMAELPRVLETTADFFARDLPPELQAVGQTVRDTTPVAVVASLIQQVTAMAVSKPAEGRCHFADLDVSITPAGEETFDGRLRFVHGSGHRFRLDCRLPVVGEASLGQSGYPWIASGSKAVFKGVCDEPAEPVDPLALADAWQVGRLKMLAGAAAGVALAPDVLNQFCTVADGTRRDGPRAIDVVIKGNSPASFRLSMRDDGRTPQMLSFNVAGTRGRIVFRGWQTNTVAHASMFAEPEDVPVKEVPRDDVYRVFAAMFNFAMENAQ